MDTYRLRLTLESPLAVSGSRDTANRSETRSAVPPTTLRGALAARVRQNGADDATLMELFGETGCRTGALRPVASGTTAGTVTPAPLTLRSCKFQPGFHADVDPKGRSMHGVEDLLFAALRFALREDGSGLSSARACAYPGCTHVLKAMGGFVRHNPEAGTWHKQGAADTRTQAHVGLDRRRRGAASGILYSREVISEKSGVKKQGETMLHPTQMQADVIVPPDMSRALTNALAEGDTLRVGTARSRGLGRCTVASFSETAGPSQTVEERIAAFNAAWADVCERSGHSPDDGSLVALTLDTTALFVDDFLRPNLAPSGADLLQAAQPEEDAAAAALAQLSPVHQIARSTSVQSWNGLARFPHPSAQGLEAGSVLVFRATEMTDALLDALSHVETHGIGLRRHFGFGRVRVCAPIHTHVHEHTAAAPTAA